MKRALITGITGQSGSYLAELLLDKGYEVFGTIRRSSSLNTSRIDHIFDRLKLHYCDVTDAGRVAHVIGEIQPDEIYNLACQSHVKVSFDEPAYSVETVAMGTLNVLEAARRVPNVRVYQASSSEMFGNAPAPQSEATCFQPRSPYACAKCYAHWQAVNYRQCYGMFVSCGILFNHESPRRGETFVTRKITRGLTRIKHGLQDKLLLGNLDAKRDWGFAGDYVRAMWRMLQHHEPDDFVVATGEANSVRKFLADALEITGVHRSRVEIDPRYLRPGEVNHLLGDSAKVRSVLGWEPRVSYPKLVEMMVAHDDQLARAEASLRKAVA